MRIRKHLPYLFWGTLFGFIIARAGAVRFDYIRDMFLLKEFRMYGIIGSAIAVGMLGLEIFKRLKKAGHPSFAKLHIPKRQGTPGTVPGAAIFGIGWALTGTCPGPAAVQLGQGHWIAIATLVGILIGNVSYEMVHRRFFHWTPESCS